MLEHRRIAGCTTVHLTIVGLALSELSCSAAAEQRGATATPDSAGALETIVNRVLAEQLPRSCVPFRFT